MKRFGYWAAWALLAMSPLALADAPVYAPEGVALRGYDVVAYFVDGEAVAGDPEYSYQWHGVEWRFASPEHRDLFVVAPENYAPEFGGFCALGVAHGALVPADPRAWTIHDNRLIVNQNTLVAETWRYNPDINLQRAERAYPDAIELFESWQRQRGAKEDQQ